MLSSCSHNNLYDQLNYNLYYSLNSNELPSSPKCSWAIYIYIFRKTDELRKFYSQK